MAETDEPIGDSEIIEAMLIMGGSFVRVLGDLARHADPENLRRLKAAFPEYWDDYRGLADTRRKQQRREGHAHG